MLTLYHFSPRRNLTTLNPSAAQTRRKCVWLFDAETRLGWAFDHLSRHWATEHLTLYRVDCDRHMITMVRPGIYRSYRPLPCTRADYRIITELTETYECQ